jgi:hypothetical protein
VHSARKTWEERRVAEAPLYAERRSANLRGMSFPLRCVVICLSVLGRVSAAEPICRIELNDVQGLFGGTEVVLKAKGELVVRTVRPPEKGESGLREHRARGAIDFPRVLSDVGIAGLDDYHEHDRSGVPDEARPTIIIYFASGDRKVVSKWAGDKDPAFDDVYRRLLKLTEISLIAEYDGRYTYGLGE